MPDAHMAASDRKLDASATLAEIDRKTLKDLHLFFTRSSRQTRPHETGDVLHGVEELGKKLTPVQLNVLWGLCESRLQIERELFETREAASCLLDDDIQKWFAFLAGLFYRLLLEEAVTGKVIHLSPPARQKEKINPFKGHFTHLLSDLAAAPQALEELVTGGGNLAVIEQRIWKVIAEKVADVTQQGGAAIAERPFNMEFGRLSRENGWESYTLKTISAGRAPAKDMAHAAARLEMAYEVLTDMNS